MWWRRDTPEEAPTACRAEGGHDEVDDDDDEDEEDMGVDYSVVDMEYSTLEIFSCIEFYIWKSEKCINYFLTI